MKSRKWFLCLLAAVLCLVLTACAGGDFPDFPDYPDEPDEPVTGADWRTWGIVDDSGTITRDGEDIDVLICIHSADARFYNDTDSQSLFDSVDYPITLDNDVERMYQGIEFSDLNSDGNSDVTMKFSANVELVMVWFWDSENYYYVFQPDESQIDGFDPGYVPPEPEPIEYLPTAPELMCDELPFANMQVWGAISYGDGSYRYKYVSGDGQITVVSTALTRNDEQNLADYVTDCALSLGEADNYVLHSVEKNDEYSKNMSCPVYVVTYTAGGNEDTREWTVFAMDTDSYTYLYGICAAPEAVDEVKSVYQGIFSALYLFDWE